MKPTQEMIDAGVRAFWSFDERFEGASDVVARIWEAMWVAIPYAFDTPCPGCGLSGMHTEWCLSKTE